MMKRNAASMLHESPLKAPFRVPEGYFDALPTRIAARIEQWQQAPFRLPEGYFAHLPQAIDTRITQQTLPAQPSEAIFDTPEDYFENLAQRVQARIATQAPVQQPAWYVRGAYWAGAFGLLCVFVWLGGRYVGHQEQQITKVAQAHSQPKVAAIDSSLLRTSPQAKAHQAQPISPNPSSVALAPKVAQSPVKQVIAPKNTTPTQKLTQIDKRELLEYLEGIDIQDDLFDKFIEAQATPEELRQRLEGEEDDLRSELEHLKEITPPATNSKNQQKKKEPHKE